MEIARAPPSFFFLLPRILLEDPNISLEIPRISLAILWNLKGLQGKKRKKGNSQGGLECGALAVMAGLVPVIHVDAPKNGAREKRDRSRPKRRRDSTARRSRADVDNRDKPGHDGIAAEMAATLGVTKNMISKFLESRLARKRASVREFPTGYARWA